MPAYQELLMDGAKTHALACDGNVQVVASRIPGSELLSYIRRLNLTRSMLNAVARSNATQLSQAERVQLESRDRQLLQLRNQFMTKVQNYVNLLNKDTETTTQTEKQRAISKLCRIQLAMERAELAAGTAKVQAFKYKR